MEVMATNATEMYSRNGTIRRFKLVYAIILILCLLWCSLFISVPFLADGSSLSRKASAMITLFFSPICHQAANRSFQIYGHPLAVCARCTGIYGGFLLGVILYPFIRGWKNTAPPPNWLLIAGLLPSGLEFILSRLRGGYPDPLLRSFTGSILGGAVSIFVVPAIFNAFVLRGKSSLLFKKNEGWKKSQIFK